MQIAAFRVPANIKIVTINIRGRGGSFTYVSNPKQYLVVPAFVYCDYIDLRTRKHYDLYDAYKTTKKEGYRSACSFSEEHQEKEGDGDDNREFLSRQSFNLAESEQEGLPHEEEEPEYQTKMHYQLYPTQQVVQGSKWSYAMNTIARI